MVEGALWPARRIADELVAQSFGSHVLNCLERAKAVPASHRAQPGERPNAQAHYDSLRVTPVLDAPSSLTLVDDVVTRGDTLIAAASRVQEAYPSATVRAFAVVRTMGLVEDIKRIVEPVVGMIKSAPGGYVDRQP